MPADPPSPSPSSPRSPRPFRGIGLYATIVCLLAATASVISFVRGSWLGVVWLLMAGLTSNMAWYYLRKHRLERAAASR